MTTTASPTTERLSALLRELRRDLFSVSEQPLWELPASGVLARHLPRRLPHTLVVYGCLAGTILIFIVSVKGLLSPFDSLLGVAHLVCVLLAAYRPMAGWWMSLAVFTAAGVGRSEVVGHPWTALGAFTQLAVLLVVALRAGPRLALAVWLITNAFSAWITSVGGLSGPGGNGALFAIGSGLVMVLTQALRGHVEARQELHAQVSATAGERSQRTLLEERARIARELHDVVAHHMSVIAIQAEAAPYRVADPPEELTRSFATIRENAVDALNELRRVLGVLRSDSDDLNDLDDPDAPQPTLAQLGELVDNVRAAGLTVDTTVTGTPRGLPAGVELSAFRIIQEALSNVLRHAPGAEVQVEIGYVLTGVGVTVRNGAPRDRTPGSGPGPAAPPAPYELAAARLGGPASGHGLLGMRERANMVGGELTAETTAEGGYEVVAFLPLVPPSGAKPGPGAEAESGVEPRSWARKS